MLFPRADQSERCICHMTHTLVHTAVSFQLDKRIPIIVYRKPLWLYWLNCTRTSFRLFWSIYWPSKPPH